MQAQSQIAPALSVIKTVYEGDVRRFTLTNFEFDALKATITQLYPELAAADFSVKFSDEDGDLITISSKAELLLALKSAHDQGLKALKVLVSKPGAPAADFVEVATPAAPATPKPAPEVVAEPVSAAPVPTPAPAPVVEQPAPAADSKEEVKPQPAQEAPKLETKTEAKTESKESDQCAYVKKLALAFVSDAAVQAALPELSTRLIALVLPEGDRKEFTAQQLIDAALAFPAIKEHASVQQLLPLLPLVMPRVEAAVKAVNQVLATADPAMIMLFKGFAGSVPVMVGRLAPHLPTLLEQIFAHCAQAKAEGGCAFASPFKFNGDEVDIDLSGLPMLLGPLAPLFAEALGSAASGAAGAPGAGAFPLPCFFRGTAAPSHGPADVAGVFDVLRGFVAGEAPQDEAEAEDESACSGAHEAGTHPNVKCDGCAVLPIKGIRFKCLRCPNFDLCETCEAKNTHPANHPLMKIRPETVKPAPASNVHQGIKCDGCGVEPITGVRYKCTKCPDFDLCEACEAKNTHAADHPLIKMREARRRGCGGGFGRRFGFGFGPFAGHHGHGHHGHGRFGPAGPATAGAGHCPRRFGGFRRFMNFMQQQNQAAASAANAGEGKDGQRFQAVFVRDVTIPDRSEINANSEHVKIWELRNTGEVAWPEGSKLIFLRGDRELSAQEEFLVPVAQPGQSVEVVAVIKAPAKPGRYAAYYRLADANREVLYGPRVWVDVVVKEEAKVAPAAQPQAQPAVPAPAPVVPTPAPVPVAKPVTVAPPKEDKKEVPVTTSKYPAQMQVLLNMGFANTELNEYLLANNDGNVQKVAHFLLDKMYGQR